MRGLVSLVISALIAVGAAGAEGNAPVDVFAAASMAEAMNDAAPAFKVHTGVTIRTTLASSANLAQQIDKGAPADVFISADAQWMDWAASHGLIAPGTRRDIASNSLVLIAPAGSPVRPFNIGRGSPLARMLGDRRLAVGDVASVPAGIYAKAALQSLGLWDGGKDHLAQAENVRAALAFVARGEAPLGIVYATDAKAEPKVKVVAVFPESSHPPIVYPAAVTRNAKDPKGAREFLDFLTSREGQTLMRRRGFGPPLRQPKALIASLG
jgi:molybdate transport system substrate-binding protein